MRVVVDTNVVVSALLFGASVPGRAFVRVLDRGTILTSRFSSESWTACSVARSSTITSPAKTATGFWKH